MAHLLRLIVAFLLLAAGSAHAAFPASTSWYWTPAGPTTTYGSASEACAAAAAAIGGDYKVDPSSPATDTTCFLLKRFDAPDSTGLSKTTSCPAFSENAGGGMCTCVSGKFESAGKCVATDPNGPGQVPGERQAEKFCAGMGNGGGWKQVGQSSGSTPEQSCYMPTPPFDGADANKGCVTKLGDSVAVPNADGTRSWSAYGTATGAVCSEPPKISDGTSNQNPPPRAAENPCPKGYPGTVNGAQVCVPVTSTSGVDSTVKTTSTNADGTKAEVIEETKCSGGICTTTTTTNNYNNAGVSTGTTRTSSTEPIGAKCAKTPANKVCTETGTGSGSGSGSGSGGSGGGESKFDGNCQGGFKAVSEDAVLNAMAEEQYRRNCEVLSKDSTEAKAVQAASDKEGTTKADNPNDFEVKVGPSNFDQSDALGGGGCSLDKTITVAKMQVTLPFNVICNPLAALGQLLVAVSLLGAMVILTRG